MALGAAANQAQSPLRRLRSRRERSSFPGRVAWPHGLTGLTAEVRGEGRHSREGCARTCSSTGPISGAQDLERDLGERPKPDAWVQDEWGSASSRAVTPR